MQVLEIPAVKTAMVALLYWIVCKVHKCAFLALKLWCNVECCIDFEGLTRRSIESLSLHKSFSTNLMQHTGSMDAGQRERMADDAAKVRKTPCHALGSLLAAHGVTHVDILVLDVEGSELE